MARCCLKGYYKIIQPVIIALDADAKKKMFKMINELVKYNIPVTYVDWKSEERDIAEMGSA